MQYKASKKVLAILLLVCMLMSSFTNIAFAFNDRPVISPGGENSSGATYNEGSGSADIVTGTASGGADQFASRNQWAITEKNGTFTRT
jgi:hypothetical protein